VAWTLSKGGPNTPSLVLAGNELYMVSDAGIASCVDARTGKVYWQERVGQPLRLANLRERANLLSE
jgi:outer membrane protein assembly factor BamB